MKTRAVLASAALSFTVERRNFTNASAAAGVWKVHLVKSEGLPSCVHQCPNSAERLTEPAGKFLGSVPGNSVIY